jgi:hypothetical protein
VHGPDLALGDGKPDGQIVEGENGGHVGPHVPALGGTTV